MVLIALVIVPFWQAGETQAFLDWYSAYSPNSARMMLPLGPGGLVLTILVFFMERENKILWGLTIAFLVANVGYFPIYFLPANAAFAEQTIAISEVSAELATWLDFHWHRIILALGALLTSTLAVVKKPSKVLSNQRARELLASASASAS
ncbi:MAG: hypothetical protein MJK13_17380 [Pseudomonadales bacterium]|nr:hypothetical protein [Pseudomonadales bacterium]